MAEARGRRAWGEGLRGLLRRESWRQQFEALTPALRKQRGEGTNLEPPRWRNRKYKGKGEQGDGLEKVIVRLCVIKLTFGLNKNKWIIGLEMDRTSHPCFQRSLYKTPRTGQASQLPPAFMQMKNRGSLLNFKALFCPTFSNVTVNLKPERTCIRINPNS